MNIIRWSGVKAGYFEVMPEFYELIRDGQLPSNVPFVREDIRNFEPCALMKSHAPNNGAEIHKDLGLKTVGIVYVQRNPLDMLLSYINFTRIQYSRSSRKKEYAPLLCFDMMGFDRIISPEEWEGYTLDNIPREHLDHALNYFMSNSLSIPLLKNAQASWLIHVRGWRRALQKIPGIILRYEDLISDSSVFNKLTSLFSFDTANIHSSIEVVDARTRDCRDTVFFNKMRSNYFPEYFSPILIETFMNRFEKELVETGYADMHEAFKRGDYC